MCKSLLSHLYEVQKNTSCRLETMHVCPQLSISNQTGLDFHKIWYRGILMLSTMLEFHEDQHSESHTLL